MAGSATDAGNLQVKANFTNRVHAAIHIKTKPYRLYKPDPGSWQAGVATKHKIDAAEQVGKSRGANPDAAMRGEADVATLKRLALTVLDAVGKAEAQFVGKAVTLTDGTAGTVEAVWLDDFHGLRLSIRGHPGKRPVSIVRFAQG
jgi:hypothetical protein